MSGNGTLTLTRTAEGAEMTSTLDPLNLMDDIVNGSCTGTMCDWSLSDAPKFVWIDYWAAEDLRGGCWRGWGRLQQRGGAAGLRLLDIEVAGPAAGPV